MSAIEIEFMRNRSRFKGLHYEDQVRLMKEYKRYGTYPFEHMNHSQRTDFRRTASRYLYIEKGNKMMMSVITKKKKGFENECEYSKKIATGLQIIQ